MVDGLEHAVIVFAYEVGCDYCCASAPTQIAVDEHIASFSIFLNKLISHSEVLLYLLFLCVIHRDVEIAW